MKIDIDRHTREIAALESKIAQLEAEVVRLREACRQAYRDGQDAGPIHWHPSIETRQEARIAELEAKLEQQQKVTSCPGCGVGVAVGAEHICQD